MPCSYQQSIFEKKSDYKKPAIGYNDKFFDLEYKIRHDPSPGPQYDHHELNSIEGKMRKKKVETTKAGTLADRYDQ